MAKYQKWIEPDGLLRLEGWARDGLTDEQIAHNMSINAKTLYDWKNKYSNLCNALKRGKDVVDIEVENALLRRAIGYEYEEIKTIIEQGVDGNKRTRIEKTKKHIASDVTAQIFWLKNRKKEAWRDSRNNEQSADKGQLDELINVLAIGPKEK